jgi:hypothetical protein
LLPGVIADPVHAEVLQEIARKHLTPEDLSFLDDFSWRALIVDADFEDSDDTDESFVRPDELGIEPYQP